MQSVCVALIGAAGGVCLWYGARNYQALTTVAVTFPFSALLLVCLVVQATEVGSKTGTANMLFRKLALLYAALAAGCFFIYLCMDSACACLGHKFGGALTYMSAAAVWVCGAAAVASGYA